MPKGYWIAHVTVTDPETYPKYITANARAFAKYGARFLVRAGKFENPEGSARPRNVVLEFPSYEAALACYHSPEYADALAIRKSCAEADVVIIEGWQEPPAKG